MKINKFNNLYQLILWPNLFPVNCYIFEELHELTLIDTGMPASFIGIAKTIEELNKPLTNIVLTHAHGDHVGSIMKCKEEFPDACVSISLRDHRLLKGDTSLDENEPQTPIKGGVPKNLNVVADRLLKEGDKIGSLEAVETPGHTPGSISLLDRNTGALIVGDAFQTQGKVAVCGQLVISFPFPAFGTWNKELSLESAKKIHQLSPSLLAAGHGKVLTSPEESIKRGIIEAERKLSAQMTKEA
ncbi:MBL fold metallo-hydrolase [Lysinibacillus yapensis]|uniref:MBL fold metallo-hydrolase n=1 Tax=Ureibacillus yapensis TaxID=2304605 RepID=A0A396SJZ5_9BACL|nr:MBL fold metallo-hydrolase [Lysinibacillus yapensis]RHW34711.1 MBL fold metallo-hydrolase [Lysinibacillus yapensis]